MNGDRSGNWPMSSSREVPDQSAGHPIGRAPLLVVDDDRATLDSLRRLLQDEFEVILAGPDQAYQQALESWAKRPDLRVAIVDLRLRSPDGGVAEHLGFELACLLKARAGSRIAIHTAYGTPANAQRTLELGLDAFIRKDTPAEAFLGSVRKLLSHGSG